MSANPELARIAAKDRLLRAALRCLGGLLDEDPHADSDADAEYADEQFALAARDLATATNALPAGCPARRVDIVKRSGPPTRTVPLARTPGLSRSPRQRRAPRDTGPSPAVRKLVLERDGYACVCCGASIDGRPYSLQHRKRRSQGGDNSPTNLVTVLGTGTTGCHERIDSRRDPHDEAKGYTVRSWQDPALVPVMVMSGAEAGMSLYPTEDGRWSAEAPEGAAA